MSEAPVPSNRLSKDMTDVLIRVASIAVVVYLCVRVFTPFLGLMLWALILAVALYPLHRGLAARLGGRTGRAATLIVLIGILLIGVPTAMLGSSFAGQVHDLYAALDGKSVEIRPPDPAVAEWPLVGERLYNAWQAAATDLPGFLEKLQPQLGNLAKHALAMAANTAGAVLAFLGSLVIAGIMMAYGESGSRAMERISIRLSGPAAGPRVHSLSTATIRSVATGVIGVAFIQALLLGIGFLFAGIPGAGVLALVVLLLGILQAPALLVSLPAIGYIWWGGDGSTVMNVVWTVYLLVAGFADNVLKPLLLGRGVDVPMPVVLLGALGGMISGGIIGLFVGAVILAVGYQLFMDWVDEGQNADATAPTGDTGAATDTGAAGS
ncbi:MAG: AI-2E family transporter [Gammaproteobacteria bacterium]|nr:AI-2E family transporter [Gammaproteobacteria bacterium]